MDDGDELGHLFRTAPVGLAVLDRGLRLLRVNEYLGAFGGNPVETCVGRTLEEAFPEFASQLVLSLQQVIETKEPILGVEVALPAPTEIGTERHWIVSAHPIQDGAGTIQQICIVLQDITAHKRAQEDLRTTQEYLDTVLLNLPVGVAIMEGPDFRYYRVNERLAEINGLRVEDHLDRPLAEILPDAAADIVPGLRRVLETGEPRLDREFSTRLPKDPDVTRHFIDSFFPIKGADGEPRAVGAVVLEITARKDAEEALQRSYAELEQRVEARTAELTRSNTALRQEIAERTSVEEALRKSEARLADIIDIAADAIISIDSTQRIILFNKAAEEIFGYSADDLLGQSLDVLIPPELWANHREHVTAFGRSMETRRAMVGRQIRGRRKNGEEFPAEAAISKIEADGQFINTVVLRDVSAREQAEETLRQQRGELAHVLRTATMSELTGALAHEINQPLTAIRSNAEAGKRFMRTDTPDLAEIGEILDDIIDDDRRAADVIRHMRALLSKHEVDRQPIDVNELVSEVIGLVHSDSVIKRVVVDTNLTEDLPLVDGDRIQLQQVFLNLVLNGFDAMQDVPVDERRLVISTAVQGEKAVCVSIQDHGVGFGEQDVDRLFTPFHTTKADGLGMGLAISRSIVEAHAGEILGREDPDGGAVFEVTLPVRSASIV
jgi:two-component system sensor kinase FixL